MEKKSLFNLQGLMVDLGQRLRLKLELKIRAYDKLNQARAKVYTKVATICVRVQVRVTVRFKNLVYVVVKVNALSAGYCQDTCHGRPCPHTLTVWL